LFPTQQYIPPWLICGVPPWHTCTIGGKSNELIPLATLTVYIKSRVWVYNKPSENAIPRKTPNKLIAMTSSKDDAAMTNVGIPCSTPNPFCCRVRS